MLTPRFIASLLLAGFSPAVLCAESWTLDRAIATALENSPDARIARARIEGAQAYVEQANAAWLPQLSLSSRYTDTNSPLMAFGSILNQRAFNFGLDFNHPGRIDNLNATGTVAYNLYSGGRATAVRTAARAGAAAADRDLRAAQQQLATEVVRAALNLRKAREGKRDSWPSDADAYTGYSAVNILWPVFMVQLGMLRAACAYMPTDRRMQAHLFALEACAAESLAEFDPAVGAICMRWLANFNLLHDSFLLEFVTQQTRAFLYDAGQGKSRFRRLPRLLDEISPFSQAYQDFERAVAKQAHTQGAKPQDMTDLSAWPVFKW